MHRRRCSNVNLIVPQEKLRGVDDGASERAEAREEGQEEEHDGHVRPA